MAPLAHPLIPDLEHLVSSTLANTGYQLRGVHLHTHRIPMTLQVLLQRSDGQDIHLDECADLSGPLADAIETAGVLGEAAYVLEVSSPGVSEELHDDRDFRSFRGFPVAVLFRDPQGGEGRCEGLLLERDLTDVRLNIRGRTKRIPRAAVIQVRLITAAPDN